jgi:hypothetical protein
LNLETFCIVVGVYEIMIGIPLLVKPLATGRWLEGAMKEDALLRAFCLLFLILAVLVLTQDASIGTDAAGLVRLLAWATALECLVFCWWTKWARAITSWFCDQSRWMRFLGILATGIGVWLLKVSGSAAITG